MKTASEVWELVKEQQQELADAVQKFALKWYNNEPKNAAEALKLHECALEVHHYATNMVMHLSGFVGHLAGKEETKGSPSPLQDFERQFAQLCHQKNVTLTALWDSATPGCSGVNLRVTGINVSNKEGR